MKLRKWSLVFVLVLILLVASVVAVNAAAKLRVTGGINYPYPPDLLTGWAWGEMNITIDQDGKAEGMFRYKSYTVDKPKDFGGWIGEPICGALGEYMGLPTVAIVVRVADTVDAPEWVGKYAKFTASDGGPKAEDDLVGLVAWGPEGPVDEQPECVFEEPFFAWPGVNGNFTIHMPGRNSGK